MTYEERYKQGKKDALDEVLMKVREYASVWMEYTDDMTKEEISLVALTSTKSAIIDIIEGVKNDKN